MNRGKALFAEEPVMVSTAVAGVLGWAASYLVLHGVVSNTVASATVQQITPSLVTGVMIALGIFIRQYVMPWVTREQQALQGPAKPAQTVAVALSAPTVSGSVPSTVTEAQIASEPVAAATAVADATPDVARFTG